MSHILRWSSLAALSALTALAMTSVRVTPAAAGDCAQSGRGDGDGSCRQTVGYSQYDGQYGQRYDSRGNGSWTRRSNDHRNHERSRITYGYGYRDHNQRARGEGDWQYRGRDSQRQQAGEPRRDGRGHLQGQRGQDDRDGDRERSNDSYQGR